MWIENRSLRERRVIALGVALAMALAMWFAIIVPIVDARDSHLEWLQDTRTAIADDRGLVRIESALQKKLTEVRRSPLWARLYSVKSKEVLIGQVQNDVGAVVRAAGASVQTVTPLAAGSRGAFERAGVRVTVSLTIDQLQNLLEKIESNARLLRVEKLGVIAPQLQIPEQNPALAITMDIYGYARVENSPGVTTPQHPPGAIPEQRLGSLREHTQS